MDDSPSISAATNNFFAAKLAEGMSTAGTLQACARAMLQRITAFEMLDAPHWGASHPQAEQTALSRLDELATYKVAHAVWRVVRNSGQRPTKMLGRKWLAIVWPDIKLALTDGAAELVPAEAAETFVAFIDAFDAELTPDSLFWASNFDAALETRREARRQAAAGRVEELARLEAELSADLSQSLFGDDRGAADQGSDGPQIEEVDDQAGEGAMS